MISAFPIVNFSLLCSNIPAAPALGVYTSQLKRYSKAGISYDDFLDRGLLLTKTILNQEFIVENLKSTVRKFNGRYMCLQMSLLSYFCKANGFNN